MATQKKNSGTKGQSNLDIGNRFRSSLGNSSNVANNEKRDDENIPWPLLITVLAVLLTFFYRAPSHGVHVLGHVQRDTSGRHGSQTHETIAA